MFLYVPCHCPDVSDCKWSSTKSRLRCTGKLWSRARKIAFALLNRFGKGSKGVEGNIIKVGDRVALVYPNNDPLGFMCAFYGCLTAGVVPVTIEVPLSRRDSSTQQLGFLLGSCGISHALTSEACFKSLPKASTGEVHSFKGWPRLEWFVAEHLTKPPKDWQPPPRHADSTTAYIEYYVDKEGSMKGVAVTRQSLVSHCRALTAACGYTEGDVMVCVVDYKREMGLWHCVLTVSIIFKAKIRANSSLPLHQKAPFDCL